MSQPLTRSRPADPETPRTWLLLGDKLGDNRQVEILVEALGWPCERRTLVFQPQFQKGKPRFQPSLHHLDSARSDPLEPPWPDLVITSGRRPSMAALWVKGQSRGQTRVVLVGRPKRMAEAFDLIITTAQYRLPDSPRVVQIGLPLMRADGAAIAAAAEAWRGRLAALPRLLTALLVGGPTKPFRFDTAVATELADQLAALQQREGGTLYVSTSRRTPTEVEAVLAEALPEGAVLHRWTAEAEDNPYLALLGLADRFVVTGDSISMLVEVARLGRPLAIFELPRQSRPFDRLRLRLTRALRPPLGSAGSATPLTRLGDLLYRLELVNYSRDFAALHELLLARGLAVRFGAPFPTGSCNADDELALAADRVRGLFGSGSERRSPC